MAEMTWTSITIGGELPQSKLEDLREALLKDFCSGDIPEDSEFAIEKGKPLEFQGEVNYGNPHSVMDFCRENNLTYWRHFDAGSEWDAGICIWRPGMEEEKENGASTQGYEASITLQELQRHVKAGNTLADVIAKLDEFNSSNVPAFTLSNKIERSSYHVV